MARKSVRALWAAKLEKKLPPNKGIDPATVANRKPFQGVVLGIDPSLRGTGFAILQFVLNKPAALLFSRTLKLNSKLSLPVCLGEIFQAVTQVLESWPVDHTVLEQTIYVQNFQTAQALGAARGAAIAAAVVRHLPIYEYPPLRVKQAVVGFGRASKEQMARTVKSLLGQTKTLSPDEADAAGVALCHALTFRGERVVEPKVKSPAR